MTVLSTMNKLSFNVMIGVYCVHGGCINGKYEHALAKIVDGRCVCDPGWIGRHCETKGGFDCTLGIPHMTNVNGCYNHGNCNGKTRLCECFPGWSGEDCNNYDCRNEGKNGVCNGSGSCTVNGPNAGKCICTGKWFGKGCTEHCVNGDVKNGVCRCHKGYRGYQCTIFVCRHGKLTGPETCVCDSKWTGPNCDKEFHCNLDHTDDINSRCVCKEGWKGASCEVECIHGHVEKNMYGEEECICDEGWHSDESRICHIPDDIDCGHGRSVSMPLESEKQREMICVCDPGWMPKLDSNGSPLDQRCTECQFEIDDYGNCKNPMDAYRDLTFSDAFGIDSNQFTTVQDKLSGFVVEKDDAETGSDFESLSSEQYDSDEDEDESNAGFKLKHAHNAWSDLFVTDELEADYQGIKEYLWDKMVHLYDNCKNFVFKHIQSVIVD